MEPRPMHILLIKTSSRYLLTHKSQKSILCYLLEHLLQSAAWCLSWLFHFQRLLHPLYYRSNLSFCLGITVHLSLSLTWCNWCSTLKLCFVLCIKILTDHSKTSQTETVHCFNDRTSNFGLKLLFLQQNLLNSAF